MEEALLGFMCMQQFGFDGWFITTSSVCWNPRSEPQPVHKGWQSKEVRQIAAFGSRVQSTSVYNNAKWGKVNVARYLLRLWNIFGWQWKRDVCR